MPSDDIRLAASFFDHPKTVRMERRCGLEGVVAVLRLWCWAATHRPNGSLHDLEPEEVETFARAPQGWLQAATEIGFLERQESGNLALHGWTEHQPYVATREARIHAGKVAAYKRWGKRTQVLATQGPDGSPIRSPNGGGLATPMPSSPLLSSHIPLSGDTKGGLSGTPSVTPRQAVASRLKQQNPNPDPAVPDSHGRLLDRIHADAQRSAAIEAEYRAYLDTGGTLGRIEWSAQRAKAQAASLKENP